MRQYVPAVLEVLGLISISASAFLVAFPLGLLVTGLSLAALGVGIDRLTGSPHP